jgi:ElaB/YqjD/DUF883 family membrane-anchored ribosome-binding protein
MSLQSKAQELIVVDPSMSHMEHPMSLVPLEIEDESHEHSDHMEAVEVDDDPMEIKIIMELPGAPPGTKDPEPIEVSEDEEDHKDHKDENKAVTDEDAAKAAKNEKWNWAKHGPTGFIAWVKERCDDVPKHSGYDSAGLERAIAYLERLDNEVSKAMRLDIDGDLDANQVEKVRAVIDNGIEKLNDRLDKVKSSKKKSRKKKAELSDNLVKEAQKITGVQGIFVTVPLLISRIARVCINGMVSGGHDIEDLFERQVKFYKLNDREQAEVMQLLSDMGYSVKQDRGFMPNQDMYVEDSDNMDWAANYKG